ncbi:phage baseplate assembly protein V [Janthinobacterium aestuarii]
MKWATPRADSTRTWSTPTVSEQVTVFSPGGDLTHASSCRRCTRRHLTRPNPAARQHHALSRRRRGAIQPCGPCHDCHITRRHRPFRFAATVIEVNSRPRTRLPPPTGIFTTPPISPLPPPRFPADIILTIK